MNIEYDKDDDFNVGGMFGILPAAVRYDNNIPPMGRLIYSEIAALSNQKGYCWPRNSHFSKVFEITKGTASTLIAKLVDSGYIRSEIINKDGVFYQRRLYPLIDKLTAYPPVMKNRGIAKNRNTPIEKSSTKIIIKDNIILKNNTTSEEVETSSKNKIEKIDFPTNEFIEFWNSAAVGQRHLDSNKQVYKRAAVLFSKLKKGVFWNNDFDEKFLVENNLSKDIINKKWTAKEIQEGLQKLIDAIKDGSDIWKLDKVRHTPLADLLYNPKTKKSYFLKYALGTVKKSIPLHPGILKKYKALLNDQITTTQQSNGMIAYVNGLYKEVQMIYKRIEKYYAHTSFSSYLGSSKNPEPFFNQHIDYLKTKKNLSMKSISVDSFYWGDFVKYVKDTFGYYIAPDDKQLQELKREYERVQRKHENLKLQRGSR